MGATNVGNLKKNNQQIKDFIKFLEQRKTQNNKKPDAAENKTWDLEKKWKKSLSEILDRLATKQRHKQFANQLKHITNSLKTQYFIKAISVLSAMDSRQVLELNSKTLIKQGNKKDETRQSKNVFMIMQKRFKVKQKFNQSLQTDLNHDYTSEPKKLKSNNDKELKDKITLILTIEFNRNYHPFYYIKQSFVIIFQMKYRNKLDNIKNKLDEKKKNKIYLEMHKDIQFYCQFIAEACYIYKKWIIKYTNIKEDKYNPFIKRIIINSIFYGQNNLHQILLGFICQINRPYFQGFLLPRITQNISVGKFFIKKELQIEGNYVNSLQLFSEIDRLNNPKKILDLLETLKKEICNDIDLYHKYFETNESYTIDGDNLLGILCFQICRMKPKLLEIFSQITLLTVIFGDGANTNFGASSYMVTALMATFEYLQSQDFSKQIQ